MPQPSVASFDVFDTLLTRAVTSPTALFVLLGRELADAGLTRLDPAAFRAARVRAEADAAGGGSINLVTLRGIYGKLVQAGVLAAADAQQAMGMELELETRLLRAVEPMRAAVDDCRARGQTIAFLSDMYLPAEFIRDQLAAHGFFQPRDTLLVSSDVGVDKRSGALYRLLSERLGVAPCDIAHFGDNVRSDVRSARMAGVRATRITHGLSGRFAAIMDESTDATRGLSGLIGGASRLAFVAPDAAAGESERAARMMVGAEVVAPVLISYALWLLERAEALGLTRLYFVARDGEQLINITRRVAAKVGSRVELRYLYGSRQSWHLPSVAAIGDEERSWMLEESRGLTLGRLLKRVGLAPEAIRARLIQKGLPTEAGASIGTEALAKTRELLDQDDVRALILGNAAAARVLALDYFRQEGLLDDDRWAMVDVGWMGRLQVSLFKVLATVNGPAPKGLYFGLGHTHPSGRFGHSEAFAFDKRHGDSAPDVPSLETFMEIFCSATHGSVLGYRRFPDGRVGPIFREERNAMALDWGLLDLRAGSERAADAVHIPPHWREFVTKLGPVSLRIMRELTTNPTRDEARAFAGFLFDDDQSGEGHSPLATPFTLRRLLDRAVAGPRGVRGSWTAGSIALAATPVRQTLSFARRLRASREGGAS